MLFLKKRDQKQIKMPMNPSSKKPGGKQKLRKGETGEILDMYLKVRPEDTKDGGVISLRLPKPQTGEILDVYLRMRREGTKDGGVLVRWDYPKKSGAK